MKRLILRLLPAECRGRLVAVRAGRASAEWKRLYRLRPLLAGDLRQHHCCTSGQTDTAHEVAGAAGARAGRSLWLVAGCPVEDFAHRRADQSHGVLH